MDAFFKLKVYFGRDGEEEMTDKLFFGEHGILK